MPASSDCVTRTSKAASGPPAEHHGGAITTYTYNADGLRVREEHDGVETRFMYDGNNLLRETDDTNLPEADYTYVPQAYAEAISQRRDVGDSSFYLADGIKNVRKLASVPGAALSVWVAKQQEGRCSIGEVERCR